MKIKDPNIGFERFEIDFHADPKTMLVKIPETNIDNIEPRVEAQWLAKPVMIRSPYARNYYCSNCHHEPIECGKFCPECGAKMKV